MHDRLVFWGFVLFLERRLGLSPKLGFRSFAFVVFFPDSSRDARGGRAMIGQIRIIVV